jgi:ATP-dependent Clp endopeptidase proteolytic subunit ClpP
MKQPLSFFNYSIQNQSDDTIDIYIDGYIVDAPTQQMMREFWGDDTTTSYKSLRDQINKATPKTVNIYINSGGGMVSDAMAIHDLIIDLQNKGTAVNTFGRGIVASAATYILMASKNSEISENSWFMIHNVQGGAWGDVNDIENAAKTMRKFNNQIRDLYASYTSQPAETISSWMNKETWFTGKEAKEKGFVKNTSGSTQFKNSIKPEQWPFSNVAVLNAYNSFTNQNESEMKFDIQPLIDGFKNVLVEAGVIKSGEDAKATEIANKLATTVENAVKPLTENISETVKNEVSAQLAEAIKNVKVDETLVTNAVQAELKKEGEGTVAAAINSAATAAVNVAVKDVVKKEDFEALKIDVANKLGGKAHEKAEDESERKINNKKDFYQVGSFSK